MRVFLVWKRRYADVRAGTQAPPLRVSFGWIVHGQAYRSLFTPKARSFIKSKGAHQMIDALLALFLSLLSDSNQRPRDYKSRALAN